MPQFNVLVLPSLTHRVANRLNLKYIRHIVMAEWLTHLIKDVGVLGSSLSRSQFLTFRPQMLMFVCAFFLPATIKDLRTRE